MADLATTTATLTLMEIPGSRYRLRKAIMAEIERDDAGFVVSEQSTGVFHYDPDLPRAIAGFLQAFTDQFEFLKRNEGELAPALTVELERFRSFFRS